MPDLINSIDLQVNDDSGLISDKSISCIKDNYHLLIEQIENHFESLKISLETRKHNLLNELKTDFEKRENLFDDLQDNQYEFNLNEYGDLDLIIKSYGKIQPKSKASEDSNEKYAVDCFLSGRGLKECFVNQASRFTMTFKNRTISKTNVSFLDIFIVATNDSTSKKSSMVKKIDSSSVRLRKISAAEQCNCDCKLEFISDGLYAVNYKLDKPGVYLLNVLVNKTHVGDSPYKVKCFENESKSELRIKSSKTMSSFNLSPATSSIFSPRSTGSTQSSIRHSITNENLKKNSSEINFEKKLKTVKTNSMTQLSNISNLTNITKKAKTPSMSTVSPLKIGYKLNKQHCFSFTNGLSNSITTKSTNSIDYSNVKDHSSVLNSRTCSPYLNDTKCSLVSSRSNFEFLNSENKEDDCLFQIGSRGRNCAEFLNPQAICATAEFIYISDSNNQKIDVFSHSGEYKFNLGNSLPNTSRVIRRPIGIESTQDKKILVVDYEYKCVNVFEENGKFLNRICQSRLLGPKGICVNKFKQNQIIVADAKANSVCIFDSEGKYISRFGNLGNKNENFAGPQFVACASNADIIVTDFYNHCIKIFDSVGHFKFSFGSNGLNQGQFNGPTGIAVDKNDNIIVADWGNSRIQVFDKHGTFLRFVNSETNRLYGPQDLTLINNTIAVADSGNHCVKIFEYHY